MTKKMFIGTAALMGLALVFSAGAKPEASTPSEDPYLHLETFSDALYFLQENYVDEVPVAQLLHGAIMGMTVGLDSPTVYMSPTEYARFKDDTIGRYYGVGVLTLFDEGAIRIEKVFQDSPAARAGLLAGDRIVAIDGEAVTTENIELIIESIKGPRGTLVHFKVRRESNDSVLELDVARDRIRTPSVESERLPDNLAWIRILQFQERTGRELRRTLASLDKSGDSLAGLVLDLRSNPGGYLDEAAEVADVFLEEGDIVTTKGRAIQETTETAHHPGTRAKIPIVVLQNHGTASAAEIVAGALQDHKRATIVGTTSYGKGSVQTTYEFTDGSALKITIARYYTPSGRSIHGTGIEPDLVVPAAAALLDGEEEAPESPPEPETGTVDLTGMPAWVLEDPQMMAAITHLLTPPGAESQ